MNTTPMFVVDALLWTIGMVCIYIATRLVVWSNERINEARAAWEAAERTLETARQRGIANSERIEAFRRETEKANAILAAAARHEFGAAIRAYSLLSEQTRQS